MIWKYAKVSLSVTLAAVGGGAWLLAAGTLVWGGPAARPAAKAAALSPTGPVLYTGARAIRTLAWGPDGALWAATAGGVVRWANAADPAPRRWTTVDGLGSNDVRAVLPASGGAAWAALPLGVVALHQGGAGTADVTLLPTPPAPAAEVRCLAPADGRGLIAGTSAGLFTHAADGQKWRPLVGDGDGEKGREGVWRVTRGFAVTDRAVVRLADGRRFPLPPGAAADDGRGAAVTALAADREEKEITLATALGLWRLTTGGRGRRGWSAVALPPDSTGSHVSALAYDGAGALLAGLYGDGVFRRNPKTGAWARVGGAGDTPAPCRLVTALAPRAEGLTVGTAADGVWDLSAGGIWKRRALPGSLTSADICALAAHDGALWAATFDRGVLRIDPATGTADTVEALRMVRALVPFRGRLLARTAEHGVQVLDAAAPGQAPSWQPAWDRKALPRSQVYALASDAGETRLLVGGWAGWAAWDGGSAWEHHWTDPELAGQVVTAVAGDGAGGVWIGTQKRGLLHWTRRGGYTAHHEAQGLTDDWITTIAVSPTGRILVGTYTGGLLEKTLTADRWTVRLRPENFAVRTVTFLPDGAAVAATPVGVYREERPGGPNWRLLEARRTGGLEAQTLQPVSGGLWVGTRAGLAFTPL